MKVGPTSFPSTGDVATAGIKTSTWEYVLLFFRNIQISFREGHGAMVRARSFVNVAACRGFRIPLGVSPLSILGHCFDVVSLAKALNPQMLHLTQVKMSTW